MRACEGFLYPTPHIPFSFAGQFFPDIVSFCEEMANAGKIVFVSALDGTFERKVSVVAPTCECTSPAGVYQQHASSLCNDAVSSSLRRRIVAVWGHPQPDSVERERGEAQCRVHEVLRRFVRVPFVAEENPWYSLA